MTCTVRIAGKAKIDSPRIHMERSVCSIQSKTCSVGVTCETPPLVYAGHGQAWPMKLNANWLKSAPKLYRWSSRGPSACDGVPFEPIGDRTGEIDLVRIMAQPIE